MGFLRNNSDGQPPKDWRLLKVMLVGVTLFVLMSMIPAFAPWLMEGFMAIPTIFILLLFTIASLVSVVVVERPKTTLEKQKREGMDMYSMIDRLVDDLDEDELDYLRRRLESRTQERDPKLAQSLEALLDERSETRQSQK